MEEKRLDFWSFEKKIKIHSIDIKSKGDTWSPIGPVRFSKDQSVVAIVGSAGLNGTAVRVYAVPKLKP